MDGALVDRTSHLHGVQCESVEIFAKRDDRIVSPEVSARSLSDLKFNVNVVIQTALRRGARTTSPQWHAFPSMVDYTGHRGGLPHGLWHAMCYSPYTHRVQNDRLPTKTGKENGANNRCIPRSFTDLRLGASQIELHISAEHNATLCMLGSVPSPRVSLPLRGGCYLLTYSSISAEIMGDASQSGRAMTTCPPLPARTASSFSLPSASASPRAPMAIPHQ